MTARCVKEVDVVAVDAIPLLCSYERQRAKSMKLSNADVMYFD